MAQGTRANKGNQEEEQSLEQIQRRLNALDRRLDAIDTMVTTIAERIMKQPISISIVCPNCGRILEIGIVGNEKMMR